MKMELRARHRDNSSENQQRPRSVPQAASRTRESSCDGGSRESTAAPLEPARSSSRGERYEPASPKRRRREKKQARWPDEARDAAEELYFKEISWEAVVAPFTKLAKKKGWGTAYTASSIRVAVNNENCSYKLSSSNAAMKAVQKIYEDTGSWEEVVGPFRSLAAEHGWGCGHTKTSIINAYSKWTGNKELRSRESRTRRRAVWSLEALMAAHRLYLEKRCWPAVVEAFKKLAIENGWEHERTECAIRQAVNKYVRSAENSASSEAEDDDGASCNDMDESGGDDHEDDEVGGMDADQQQDHRSDSLGLADTSSANSQEPFMRVLLASVVEDIRICDQQEQPSTTQANDDEVVCTSDHATKQVKREILPLEASENCGWCGGVMGEAAAVQNLDTCDASQVCGTPCTHSDSLFGSPSPPSSPSSLTSQLHAENPGIAVNNPAQQLEEQPAITMSEDSGRGLEEGVSAATESIVAPPAAIPASAQNGNDGEFISVQAPRPTRTASSVFAHEEQVQVVQGHVEANPILQFALSEYEKVNQTIVDLEREMIEFQTRIQAILSTNMGEAKRISAHVAQLKITRDVQSRKRDAAVARILVFCKTLEAPTVQDRPRASISNSPHVQQAIHTKCARLVGGVSRKRTEISSLTRDLQSAVDSTHAGNSQIAARHVDCLGTEISTVEQALVNLEAELLSEFVRLFQYSKEIRNEVQRMTQSATIGV